MNELKKNQVLEILEDKNILDEIISHQPEKPTYLKNFLEKKLKPLLSIELKPEEIFYIHVKPDIIAYNNTEKTDYPTVIVKDHLGKIVGLFDRVEFLGENTLMYDSNSPNISPVFLVTQDKIIGYYDKNRDYNKMYSIKTVKEKKREGCDVYYEEKTTVVCEYI